jgi:hypothetical protein
MLILRDTSVLQSSNHHILAAETQLIPAISRNYISLATRELESDSQFQSVSVAAFFTFQIANEHLSHENKTQRETMMALCYYQNEPKLGPNSLRRVPAAKSFNGHFRPGHEEMPP